MPPREAGKPLKVMLLDDEKFLLDIYRMSFEKNGYEITTFHDADDALKALRAGYSPDAILFDITMPEGKSGYEFIDIVVQEKLSERSLKIALTNEGQDGALFRTGELGVDAHLLKANFIPSQLVAKIAELLAAKPR